MKRLFTILACSAALTAFGQSPYKAVSGAWTNAGIASPQAFTERRSILDFGADAQGSKSSNAALEAAIADLGGRPGIIELPAGTYVFDAPVNIRRDSLVIRGAGHGQTRLRFDLGGSPSAPLTISGQSTTDSSLLSAAFVRGENAITVEHPERFHEGDWIRLSIDDASFMASSWALGTLGQTAQIRSIRGAQLVLGSPARFNYNLALRPRVRRVLPRTGVGLECLAIERLDATAGQSSNIVYEQAANCWIRGIESDKANFAHVELNRSANIDIRNSWFHDAHAYGGGGQGYGVLLQTGSNECLVSGNYFSHLRHSMLLQSGANGNILSYNYSTKPYWTEPGLPDSSAGEIVLHGNYPFMNLAEGNMVQNIVIDDSHGKNGPHNTFFRNRAGGYGIFMNFVTPTDSVLFIGNEITNAATGLYFLSGKGHVELGNNYRGKIAGADGAIPEKSLYLSDNSRPDCSANLPWPAVGVPGQFNAGRIAAMVRVEAGAPASCDCVTPPAPTAVSAQSLRHDWQLAPNPARDYVQIIGQERLLQVSLYDASGRLLLQVTNPAGERIGLPQLPGGLYMLRLQGPAHVAALPLQIVK